MLFLVVAFIVSLIPAFALYFWLKKQQGMPEGYAETCKKALTRGMLCVFPVLGASCAFSLAGRLLFMGKTDTILYQVYHKFIVLAFAEELVKFFTMRRVTRDRACSWLEYTIYMMLVALGFEVMEAIPYAFDSGAPHMLVRGITMMHVAFGFIIGYFYGKGKLAGSRPVMALGFVLSWLMHGLYDFSLTEGMTEMSDFFIFAPVTLAAACAVLIFFYVRFVKKAKKQDRYTTLLS